MAGGEKIGEKIKEADVSSSSDEKKVADDSTSSVKNEKPASDSKMTEEKQDDAGGGGGSEKNNDEKKTKNGATVVNDFNSKTPENDDKSESNNPCEAKPVSKKKEETKPKKTKSSGRDKKKKKPVESMKITDFFPVRRSNRKTESEIKKEKSEALEIAVLSEKEPGLEIVVSPTKGRGIVANKSFERGDFVVEYRGELISKEQGRKRNEEYAKDPSIGSYMYYFESNSTQYCVDATAETHYLGRLVNHSAKKPNLMTKVVEIKRTPHLILVAAKKIKIGEELLYDYGERSSATISENPWLKNS